MNREIKYVEPTIILNPSMSSPIMNDEIFGPVLPIVTFSHFDEVIELINSRDKPLAVYYFGKSKSNPNSDRLLNETSSGAYVVNEGILHIVNHFIGFGGVGASGYGRYGGFDGFRQWSNPKSVMIRPTLNFSPFNSINPPFTPEKSRKIKKMLNVKGS